MEMCPNTGDELGLGECGNLACRQTGAQHRAHCFTLHRRATGTPQLGENPFQGVADQNLLLSTRFGQSHVLVESATERGIRRWQPLGLGEVSNAQHLGELQGIASIVFSTREIGTFAVTFGRERIDQPPGQLMLIQEVDQCLPIVIGRFHANRYRRSITGTAKAAGSLHKLPEPAARIRHPEASEHASIGR